MIRFLLARLASAVVVVAGVACLVFALIHAVPGDPVEVMLGESASPADRDALRRSLGLDRPVHVQLAEYFAALARLDLGRSLHSQRPIADLLAERVPATASLAVVSLVVALAIALPLGILAAVRRDTAWDAGAMGVSMLGVSIPNFVMGPVLILVFSFWLGWFPVGGRDGAGSYVLPALTLGTALASILSRMVRSALLEVMGEDFMRTARAKGLGEVEAVVRHALPNAMLPIVTILGLQLGTLLGGAVITEIVFSWPGIGQLTIESIQRRDYPVLQACVLAISLAYVAVNTATDLVYAWLDPRIRLEAGLAVTRVALPAAVLLAWAAAALAAPLLPIAPDAVDLPRVLAGPSVSSWLGHDELGRPVLDRLVAGARTSFLVVAGVLAVSVALGTAIGTTSAWVGGAVDHVVVRAIDVFLAFPGILLAIALAGILGPGIENVVFALSAVGWVGFARLARAQTLSIRHREHVRAAVALGSGTPRILARHVLPLLVAPLTVAATFDVAGVVIAEAGLSFLGLGVQPPDASWGSVIREGTRYMLVAPHLVLAPAAVLLVVVLAVNLLGDRLRDRLDVRSARGARPRRRVPGATRRGSA